MKVCSQCKRAKKVSEFNLGTNGKPRATCKICKKNRKIRTEQEITKILLELLSEGKI